MSAEIEKYTFLVTGGAGFIGTALVEYLLKNKAAKVKVLDNLSTGFYRNIEGLVNSKQIEFVNGDIRNIKDCTDACAGVDYIFHQAALGSVPRSLKDPISTHQVNADGFLNILEAAKQAKVKRVVYASSSSVYGNNTELPKFEHKIGDPLSPYAVTKKINELYAAVYSSAYSMEIIGLRYFNIFGPRQNPDGEYAAVIPRFIANVRSGVAPDIYGNGEQGRDFTYIDNAVHANIQAMFTTHKEALGKVFNIACGERITVNEIFSMIVQGYGSSLQPNYAAPRTGDIKDSWADISLAEKLLEYKPQVYFKDGLKSTIKWFEENYKK